MDCRGVDVPMIVMGCLVTAVMVRNAYVPFFFRPLQFRFFRVSADCADICKESDHRGNRPAAADGMAPAAALLWHVDAARPRVRAIASGMPLLQPWAWEAAFAVTMLFPVAGVWADIRRSSGAHPAWLYGIATMIASFVLIEAITYSPVGSAIYDVVTKGSPGASVGPLDFGTPPVAGPVTGRP